MKFRKSVLIILFLAGCWSFQSNAKDEPGAMKEDSHHVKTWNKFADDLVKLKDKVLKGKQLKLETKIGGYSTDPNFYKETKYIDKKTGKLLVLEQLEKKKPHHLHVLEIYIRDKKGRVLRDYSVTFLPHARNAPVQTLINFHGYGGKMHGFRQFDVTGDLIYEQCKGFYKGKEVTIHLFEDDLVNGGADADKVMKSVPYKLCFAKVLYQESTLIDINDNRF